MARLLQIHSDGPGARTALGGLAIPLKSLAGNCRVSLPGVFDVCGRYSDTGRCRCLNRPVGGGDAGAAVSVLCAPASVQACRAARNAQIDRRAVLEAAVAAIVFAARALAGRRCSARWIAVVALGWVLRLMPQRASPVGAAPESAGWRRRCCGAGSRSCASAAGLWAGRVAAPARGSRRRAACGWPFFRSWHHGAGM